MNYKMIGWIHALILSVAAVFMLPALLICLFDGDSAATRAFLYTVMLTAAVAAALLLLCRGASKSFSAREGLLCVSSCWLVVSILGCLPFVFSGAIPSFIDALFETVSGFTTTGASILSDVEALPRGLLYWRSFSHWLGGMGILVFLLAIAPISGRNDGSTMHLLRAESPGPNVGKLVPRMKQTAKILYLLYILLTLLNIVFLLLGGMPLFDSVCTAFGTAGTGGFGIKNDSIAGCSPYLQNVCTVFMLLFGVNFNCYYLLLLRRFRNVLKDEELRLYIFTAVAGVALVALNLRGVYATSGETVRHAAFQVSSIMTTTGFSTVNFDLWPSFSKAILLCLMVTGACAGSTGGGFKCGRIVLLFKALRRNINELIRPRRVQVVHQNGLPIDEKVLKNTYAYLSAYVGIVIISFLIVSLDGFSMTSNFSAVLACFNNIGPGLDAVGPACNYAGYGVISKLVLIIDMLAGRLEIFPILIWLSKGMWKRQ